MSLENVMRFLSVRKSPLEVHGHELKGAPVIMIKSFSLAMVS